jgi:ribosomal protein S18 acetylase RimI-like enzyme
LSVIGVREFRLDDLEAAGRFCDAARAQDPFVEPFSQRLGVIATGTRAALELWRVAEDEAGALHGIAFAALRESRPDRPVFDFYCAVDPALRRQGLGRALSEPALSSGAVLRARAREEVKAGRAFLASLGFAATGAQLVLHWNGSRLGPVEMPALRIRAGTTKDQPALERLSNEAWKGAPDAFASRADEIAQLFGEEGRVVLIAESEGRAMAYLTGVQLGRTLGIEEVAVRPEFRRMGIARALVTQALAKEQSAILSVSESNTPARALYKSLGFTQSARRVVFEKR